MGNVRARKFGWRWLPLVMLAASAGCSYGKNNPPNSGDGSGVDMGADPGGTGGGTGGGNNGATVALKRPSRSSTIALTDDGFLVVMVNPDDDSISIFKTDDNSRVAKLTTGKEPS